MQTYDLCLSWYWLHDNDFIRYIGEACEAQRVTLSQITPTNVLQAVTELYSGQTTFNCLLDRANDDLRFEPIRRFAIARNIRRINAPELSHWSEDKATMHLELIQAGLQTPYTILISSFIDQPILPQINITPLGTNFVLKPAVGGGGEGVRMNASCLDDIRWARLEYPEQKYLAQENIKAQFISGREAWFRVFCIGGDCIPCWWNPKSHVYSVLTMDDEIKFELGEIRSVTEKIAKVCRLDWFSTEIALTPGGRFVVVDYVNDDIDTRIQSKATDGMPDEVMGLVADKLVALVASKVKA
jgi:glutathione synthase/RimK-type ligase-like ATP-grasp enzyme